jgi:hypothetical protein
MLSFKKSIHSFQIRPVMHTNALSATNSKTLLTFNYTGQEIHFQLLNFKEITHISTRKALFYLLTISLYLYATVTALHLLCLCYKASFITLHYTTCYFYITV